ARWNPGKQWVWKTALAFRSAGFRLAFRGEELLHHAIGLAIAIGDALVAHAGGKSIAEAGFGDFLKALLVQLHGKPGLGGKFFAQFKRGGKHVFARHDPVDE